MTKLTYRKDIDCYRGIGLLLIILHHLDFAFIKNAFTIIDIFFVISGYLITKVLHEDIVVRQNFSLFQFYRRRIRRLLPALLSTSLIAIICAPFVYPDWHLYEFYKDAFFASISLSNIFFYKTADYFSLDIWLRPFLHTWSLSLEEQFYLLWPPLIWLLFSKRKKGLRWIAIVCIALASIYLNYYYRHDIYYLFYMPHLRAFEFCAGALIIPIESYGNRLKDQYKNIVNIFGFSLLTYLFFFYDKYDNYALESALYTCLGTFLIIIVNGPSRIFIPFKNIALQKLGQASYSIYLVHWPIITFFYFKSNFELNVWQKLSLIILSILCGFAQYHLIEQRFRIFEAVDKVKRSRFFALNCFATLAFILVFSYLGQISVIRSFREDIISGRERFTSMLRFYALYNNVCDLKHYHFSDFRPEARTNCSDDAKTRILSVGNSAEPETYFIFSDALKNFDINIVMSHSLTQEGAECNFEFVDQRVLTRTPSCLWLANLLNDEDYLGSNFDAIILGANDPTASFWPDYLSYLQKRIPRLKVIIHGSLVRFDGVNCLDLVVSTSDPASCSKTTKGTLIVDEEEQLRKKNKNLDFLYVDKKKLFCPGNELDTCTLNVGRFPIIYDTGHLNIYGVEEQVRRMNEDKSLMKEIANYLDLKVQD